MRSAHPSAPLTGPDAPSALENFLDLHARKVVIGLAVVLAIVAVGVTIHLRKKKFETEAGAALVAATDLDALKKVTQDFEGTPAAKTAQLLMADRQLESGDAQGAADTLRAFIGANTDHPLVSQARLALATALVRQGKTDEADSELAAFLTASPTSPLAPLAMIQQAELVEHKGDLDAARALYEKVAANFPDSRFVEMMVKEQNRVERVGFVMPTEVEPPPPPTPAPTPKPEGEPGSSLLEGDGPIPIPGTAAPPPAPAPDTQTPSPDTTTPEESAPAAPPTQVPETNP